MKTIITVLSVLAIFMGSCEKAEIRPYFGKYEINDSLMGPPALEYYHQNYEMTISNKIASKKIKIKNISDFSSRAIVYANVNGDTFTIYRQEINSSAERYEDYIFNGGCGWFSNDSVYFEYNFTNGYGEVFSGKGYGVKKN